MKKKTETPKTLVSKSIGTKIAMCTLIPGVLITSSCGSDEPYNGSEDRLYGTPAKNLSRGQSFVLLDSIMLSTEYRAYVDVLSTSIEEIMQDQTIAIEFRNNPDLFLKKKTDGILKKTDIEVSISESDKLLLLAITDPLIQEKINNKDLKGFIQMCIQKGYMNPSLPKITDDYARFFKSQSDFDKFKNAFNVNIATSEHALSRTIEQESISNEAWGIVAGVVAGVVGAVEAGVVFDQIAWVTSLSENDSVVNSRAANTIIQQEPVMQLWFNSDPTAEIDENILYSEFVENRANFLIESLDDTYPQIDRNKLKEVIILNLQNYYGFK